MLLGKLYETIGAGTIELSCRECARDLRRQGQSVVRVLHRWDLDGMLVSTLVARQGDL